MKDGSICKEIQKVIGTKFSFPLYGKRALIKESWGEYENEPCTIVASVLPSIGIVRVRLDKKESNKGIYDERGVSLVIPDSFLEIEK